MKSSLIIPMFVFLCGCGNQQKLSNIIFSDYETINVSEKDKGTKVALDFVPGESYKNPSFVVWIESPEGKLLQTLYVTKSYGTGIFARAQASDGSLLDEPGESIRPAALPYWSHKRGILNEKDNYAPTPQNPVTDAYTGATPKSNFLIVTNLEEKYKEKCKIFVEVNQPWDNNVFWNENKYPDDLDYKSSFQPSLIYEIELCNKDREKELALKPIGHGHYSGKTGDLYTDISTLTTAKNIFDSISVVIE